MGSVGVPEEDLGACMAVGIAEGFTFDVSIIARVIDEDIGLAVWGGGEVVMAGAELAGDGPCGEDGAE